MFKRLKALEFHCDAPSYAVVRACNGCGFPFPLDGRGCRISHFLNGHNQCRRILGFRFWKELFARSRPKEPACTCGQPLPTLKAYAFTFFSEWVAIYFLGQCRRCKTMFWDVAVLVPTWTQQGVVE